MVNRHLVICLCTSALLHGLLVQLSGGSLVGTARADAARDSAISIGPLTLGQALRLTSVHQPALAAAAFRVRAAEARRSDAGRFGNPALTLSLENFGGALGDQRRETTLGVDQLVELGGDRAARARIAQSEVGQSGAARATLERDALALTAERFFDTWTLQEKIERLRFAEQLATETIAAADQRYRAGAAPVVERMRAEGVRVLRAVERRRVEAELAIARRRLATQWDMGEAVFDSLVLDDPGPAAIPPAERLVALASPDMRRAAADIESAAARIAAARAARTPDLTLTAGARRLEEVRGTGLITSVGLPLPLWNGQSGNLRAAEAEHNAAQADERAIALRLSEAVQSGGAHFASALAAYDTLRVRLRPGSQEVLQLVRTGYQSGRFSHLELLDAQRSVLEADLAFIDAKADVWRARIVLDLLAGTALNRTGALQEKR